MAHGPQIGAIYIMHLFTHAQNTEDLDRLESHALFSCGHITSHHRCGKFVHKVFALFCMRSHLLRQEIRLQARGPEDGLVMYVSMVVHQSLLS